MAAERKLPEPPKLLPLAENALEIAMRSKPHEVTRVRIADLKFDHSYQRPPIPALVAHIANAWRVDSLGFIYVSQRENGEMYVIDGQQRTLGTGRHCGDSYALEVVLFQQLTWVEENQIFGDLNGHRSNLRSGHRYRAAWQAGEKTTVALVDLLDELEIPHHWDGAGEMGYFCAWATLHALHDRVGLIAVRRALTLIREAWPDQATALQSSFIPAVVDFIERHRDEVPVPAMVRRLSRTLSGQIHDAASSRKRHGRQGILLLVYEELVAAYNYKLQPQSRITAKTGPRKKEKPASQETPGA